MKKRSIVTDSAPAAIGTYSQAIRGGDVVYLSGQIPLQVESMELIQSDTGEQIRQVFRNLSAVADAAGGSLDDIVKLNVYLVDLSDFPRVNEIMEECFAKPYPARAVIGASALPKGAKVEIDAIMVVDASK